MTQQASNAFVLRLVDAGRGKDASALPVNHARETLAATDARWIFAARVGEALEGHSAAILPPEKRDRLLKVGEVLGLRAFDANLIIAIVQDSVRCGLGALSRSTADRLLMVAGPRRSAVMTPMWSRAMIMAWGAMLGIMGATVLIQWISG